MKVMHLAVTAAVILLLGLIIVTAVQAGADQALTSAKNLIPGSVSSNG